MIAPAIVAAIISGLLLVALAVVGFFWRQLRRERERREALEDEVDQLEARVDTVWQWAFGRDHDDTDAGIADDVASGFQQVNGRLDALDERIESLEDALVESDSIEDVERDDVE